MEKENNTYWNNIIERFDFICESFPRYIALQEGDIEITYLDLKNQAQKVAGFIQQKTHDISEQPRIVLEFEKSNDYIIALIGCLYAGVSFTPLELSVPQERKDFIMNDVQPHLIINNETLREIENTKTVFKQTQIQNSDIAYIIYTSGSTGRPKGVMVSHAGIPNVIKQQIQAFDIHPKDRVFLLLAISFDASLSDILCALLSGATLCIEPQTKEYIATNLTAILKKYQITHIDMPPSLMRLLDKDKMPQTLRSIIIGGEVSSFEMVQQWAQKYLVTNVYGPTEATICTSMIACDKDWNKPLIGVPLDNVDYAISEQNELLIGGVQLAAGYWNNKELTKEKFITYETRRYYKTGDHVRREDDGLISFVGRFDRQVKIRGQLVELEEIEKTLLTRKDIAQACVIKKTHHERALLVCFLTLKDKTNLLDSETIKSYLEKKLSSWMIPHHFEIIDKMPETATGKIDPIALEKRKISFETSNAKNISTSLNSTEAKILSLWKPLLKRKDISIDDDFKALGGDSFAMIEASLLAELNDLAITPELLRTHKTIRKIAKHLNDKNENTTEMDAHKLRQEMALNDDWQSLIDQAIDRPIHENKKPKNIFVTGSNGFLASRLIHQLLTNNELHIYALVRAKNSQQGRKRLIDSIRAQGLTLDQKHNDRITIICGDLSFLNMGIDQTTWLELSKNIDTIIHSGAIVNMTAPYAELERVNIGGTQEVLKLSLAGNRKKLHYMSTLSVFVSTDQNTGVLEENDRLENTKIVYGGYAQTKWASEYLLHQIPKKACDISIYRLGLITGDTENGFASKTDFLTLFVKGFIKLNAIANHALLDRIKVDVTPVDYACTVLSTIITTEKNNINALKHNIYHIANKDGFSLSQFLSVLTRIGHNISILSPQEWQIKIDEKRKTGFSIEEAAAYFAISRTLPNAEILKRHKAMDLFQATNVVFDQKNTKKALGKTVIPIPKPSNDLLEKYIKAILEIKR